MHWILFWRLIYEEIQDKYLSGCEHSILGIFTGIPSLVWCLLDCDTSLVAGLTVSYEGYVLYNMRRLKSYDASMIFLVKSQPENPQICNILV